MVWKKFYGALKQVYASEVHAGRTHQAKDTKVGISCSDGVREREDQSIFWATGPMPPTRVKTIAEEWISRPLHIYFLVIGPNECVANRHVGTVIIRVITRDNVIRAGHLKTGPWPSVDCELIVFRAGKDILL